MARRRRESCPCGLGPSFGACCGRFTGTGVPAPTAELLMRSRFTAYARQDADHLSATWHSSSRPARLELDADLRWTALEIVSTTAGGLLDTTGTVAFRARAVAGGRKRSVEEDSAFVREAGAWTYLGPASADVAPLAGRGPVADSEPGRLAGPALTCRVSPAARPPAAARPAR